MRFARCPTLAVAIGVIFHAGLDVPPTTFGISCMKDDAKVIIKEKSHWLPKGYQWDTERIIRYYCNMRLSSLSMSHPLWVSKLLP